jgi:two-component system sensor histidine kinase HydH
LWDRLAQGVLFFDPEGRLEFANRAARELLGSPARTLGTAARELLSNAALADLAAAGSRDPAPAAEMVLAGAGGAEAPVRLERLPHPAGRGFGVVLTDLSTARRLEDELKRRERLALVGELLAGVAHEVRNPLAGISSSAQVLLGRFEPRDERTRFVRAILDEVNRLDRLVTRLLQFVRPGAPRLQQGSLEPVVRGVLAANEEWLAGAGVVPEVVIRPRVPWVWFDPDLLYQVLLNLVQNAVQAMPSGGRLTVELRALERRLPARGPGRRRGDAGARRGSGGERGRRKLVQLRLSDTGIGVAKEVQARLFDPFFTTKPTGTGLGLAICRSILEEHGGSIQVMSRRGEGTTALVEIPVEKRRRDRRAA